MTLRSRFAWIFGASIVAAMVFVAAVAAFTLNAALRYSLDAHLLTTAHAIAVLTDVHHGRPSLEGEDYRQAQVLLGTSMQGAILDNSGNEIVTLHTTPLPEAKSAAAAAPGERLDDAAVAGEARVAVVPILSKGNKAGVAIVWGGSQYIDDFVRNAIAAIFITSLIAGAIAIAASWAIAGRVLAPLERMSAIAEEIEAHDLSQRLNVLSSDEVGRLARAFDRMLERLQAAFDRQKRFTADASHELRAPLAVIQAEADVTLERERDATAYRQALTTIAQEVDRADAVISALLATARAESVPPDRHQCDLAALATRVLERFEPAMRERQLQADCSTRPATGFVDAAAIDRALAAIVHNAIDAARSKISVAVRAEGGQTAIEISDDGRGFSEEALKNATVRFWRDGPEGGRARNGLGLAIADSIVRAHGGTLQLANGPEGGARVTMVLPSFIEPSS